MNERYNFIQILEHPSKYARRDRLALAFEGPLIASGVSVSIGSFSQQTMLPSEQERRREQDNKGINNGGLIRASLNQRVELDYGCHRSTTWGSAV